MTLPGMRASLAVQVEGASGIAGSTIDGFVDATVSALPALFAGLVFVSLSFVAIRVVLFVVRSALDRVYTGDQRLITNLVVTVIAVFLWFGVALSLLSILGMTAIAASLGTAAGFVALGISYALSSMIADTVAGVYLLRDPDFNPGDRVTTDSVTGTVRAIELRKSRIDLDNGDTTVLANRDVEKKWTKKGPESAAEQS